MSINSYINLFAPRPINEKCSHFILRREETGHAVAAGIAGTLFVLAAAATALALAVLALPVVVYASVPIGAVTLILSIFSIAALVRINAIYSNKMKSPAPTQYPNATKPRDQQDLIDLECNYQLLRQCSQKNSNEALQEQLKSEISSIVSRLRKDPNLLNYAKAIASKSFYDLK